MQMENRRSKFMMLTLDLPNLPLFKEQQELGTLPQLPISDLLIKYDGQTFFDQPDGSKRKIKIVQQPIYLFLYIKRFSKNIFFKEKNPTIVNFPLRDFKICADGNQRYELVANVVHVGTAQTGFYKVQVCHLGQWYEMNDLLCQQILPEQVTVSESYLLMYRQISN